MPEILPSQRIAPTRINPKILVLYGMPKVGKTGIVSILPNTLVLDSEGGAEMYNVMRMPITSIYGSAVFDADGKLISIGLLSVYDEILKYGATLQKAGKAVQFPYKWIIIDTLDMIEEYAEKSATKKYKESTIGKTFSGDSVLDLPKGSGYYHLRNEVLMCIEKISKICKYLILVTHIKEKLLDKGGIEVSMKDISLTGKLGSMVCAKADCIGYIYRDSKKPLMVSFETTESAVMGSRFTRLSGQRFEFDWSKIYIEEPELVGLGQTPTNQSE